MDPAETLRWLCDAIASERHDDAEELAASLAVWCANGGFMPPVTGDDMAVLLGCVSAHCHDQAIIATEGGSDDS